jgi:hypothetical protein
VSALIGTTNQNSKQKDERFKTPIASLSWLTALMLAPHTLALTGRLSADFGAWHALWIAVAGGLFSINAAVLGRWRQIRRTALSSANGSDLLPGDRPRLVLLLGGRLTTALAGIAILAVSAGFLFNEIFLFWFPNFAFAYLMIAGAAIIQLRNPAVSERAQVFFSGLAASGLILLIGIGLVQEPTLAAAPSPVQRPIELHAFAAAMYLFIGFDLIYLSPAMKTESDMRASGWMIAGIVGGTILLGLWSLVSLRHTELVMLRESTVPHMAAAAKLAGPTGTKVMGIVGIAGAMAAINALLKAAARTMATVTNRAGIDAQNFPTATVMQLASKPAVWIIGVALLIGLLLALGLAGTDAVDVYFRAGLLFWLTYYASLNLAVLRHGMRRDSRNRRNWKNPTLLTSAAGALLLVPGIGILLATDPDRWELAGFSMVVYITLWLASFGLSKIIGHFKMKGNPL